MFAVRILRRGYMCLVAEFEEREELTRIILDREVKIPRGLKKESKQKWLEARDKLRSRLMQMDLKALRVRAAGQSEN